MIKWQELAIKELSPDASYGGEIENNSLVNINWTNGTTPISLEDINSKAEEIKTAKEYKDLRKAEYPSWQEQMDMQYHDAVNGTTTWKDAIAKVKADNPKS